MLHQLLVLTFAAAAEWDIWAGSMQGYGTGEISDGGRTITSSALQGGALGFTRPIETGREAVANFEIVASEGDGGGGFMSMGVALNCTKSSSADAHALYLATGFVLGFDNAFGVPKRGLNAPLPLLPALRGKALGATIGIRVDERRRCHFRTDPSEEWTDSGVTLERGEARFYVRLSKRGDAVRISDLRLGEEEATPSHDEV